MTLRRSSITRFDTSGLQTRAEIYRSLSRLAERGWSVQEIVEQDNRPDRKVYHITEAGVDQLRR